MKFATVGFAVVQRLVTGRCQQNISLNVCRKYGIVAALTKSRNVFLPTKQDVNLFVNRKRFVYGTCNYSTKVEVTPIGDNIASLQVKKRVARKKRSSISAEGIHLAGVWSIKALATADEYNLENLLTGLLNQRLYVPKNASATLNSFPDVIHATARYDVGQEPREIFFFREGSIVLWNVSELECGNVLQFLKQYEVNSYNEALVSAESEVMSYTYAEPGKRSHIKEGNIVLAQNPSDSHKFTFSNAMSQSVKLGIWEAWLDHYVSTMEYVTQDLKTGAKLRISQREVLKRQGELFALRHLINLRSDLLDTPDFYWERDDLESLYQQTCAYLSITKRTRVINEKLNHCVELVAILSSHLSDRHHIRLEWMIIILIMVEVGFEILHYVDRYFTV